MRLKSFIISAIAMLGFAVPTTALADEEPYQPTEAERTLANQTITDGIYRIYTMVGDTKYYLYNNGGQVLLTPEKSNASEFTFEYKTNIADKYKTEAWRVSNNSYRFSNGPEKAIANSNLGMSSNNDRVDLERQIFYAKADAQNAGEYVYAVRATNGKASPETAFASWSKNCYWSVNTDATPYPYYDVNNPGKGSFIWKLESTVESVYTLFETTDAATSGNAEAINNNNDAPWGFYFHQTSNNTYYKFGNHNTNSNKAGAMAWGRGSGNWVYMSDNGVIHPETAYSPVIMFTAPADGVYKVNFSCYRPDPNNRTNTLWIRSRFLNKNSSLVKEKEIYVFANKYGYLTDGDNGRAPINMEYYVNMKKGDKITLEEDCYTAGANSNAGTQITHLSVTTDADENHKYTLADVPNDADLFNPYADANTTSLNMAQATNFDSQAGKFTAEGGWTLSNENFHNWKWLVVTPSCSANVNYSIADEAGNSVNCTTNAVNVEELMKQGLNANKIASITFPADAPVNSVYLTNYEGNAVNNNGTGDYVREYAEIPAGGKFGTIALKYAAAVSGAQVFTVDSWENDVMTLALHTGVLEAGAPYIYLANDETGKNVNFYRVDAYEVDGDYSNNDARDNGLVGYYDTAYTGNITGCYLLAQNQLHLVDGGTINLGTNRCFFDPNKYQSAKGGAGAKVRIAAVGAEETAIKNVQNAVNDGKIYDMNGREVKSVEKGGMYIMGGMKVYIKK